ncbi:hypothetical protein [Caballeronia sordidicola]|uniref:Uncharacterized protein n=1 Tax=Caballeronia sordidicola TaxID=196367 RepID=A0A226WSM2_CABSO|nr:hypothetical protein [Caballeronia sordidicola]OXC73830.1 hypothetical protein BSU04_34960 [Caballeronia sordidicola]
MERHNLKNSIHALETLRDAHHSQLDASVVAEMNTVIEDLKRVQEQPGNDLVIGRLTVQALQVIACVISLVTNLKDLMK